MTKSEAFRNLLQSEELHIEIAEMKKELMDLIINSDDDEPEVREAAYMRIKVINELMARFESIAKDDEIKSKAWKIIQAFSLYGKATPRWHKERKMNDETMTSEVSESGNLKVTDAA